MNVVRKGANRQCKGVNAAEKTDAFDRIEQ